MKKIQPPAKVITSDRRVIDGLLQTFVYESEPAHDVPFYTRDLQGDSFDAILKLLEDAGIEVTLVPRK